MLECIDSKPRCPYRERMGSDWHEEGGFIKEEDYNGPRCSSSHDDDPAWTITCNRKESQQSENTH